MEGHAFGEPVKILKLVGSQYIIDQPELDHILNHAEVRDRKIVIVSIIGSFRKGKSFFLDYCLRYMYANYKSVSNMTNPLSNPAEWIGDSETPLSGFTWRSGVGMETTGLIMWSDVFLHDKTNGEKLAIVLMDTQGLDNQTSNDDHSKMFALVALLSSVQILNLFSIIQEDHLEYLQFATEFAKFGGIYFQKLMFLIRDWNNPDEYAFGIDGGKQYMDQVLKGNSMKTPRSKSVRRFVRSSFDKLDCCVMPHPGRAVARMKNYTGQWSKMDEDFLEELKLVIPSLLSPDNLIVKKINGHEMTSNLLNQLLQSSKQSNIGTNIDPFLLNILAKYIKIHNE